MNTASLHYAGFWSRLGALVLDSMIMLPMRIFELWAGSSYRLFPACCLLPETLFGLFYAVYLVGRFGGTPGKLIVGIRIRRLDGDPIGYGRAFLWYFPEFALGLLTSR